MRILATGTTAVHLTWPECEQAAVAGMKRRLLALHDRRPGNYGFKETDPWGSDIESAAAELAVARYLGVYWTPWARRPADVKADVGDDIQVRRRSKEGWDLLLHPEDPPHHRYVLVYGSIPEFRLAGWIAGEGGQSDSYWGDPYNTGRPAFWVPETELEPMEDLRHEK